MPRKSRRPYSLEFRQQMVELAAAGRVPSELEREFDVTAASIRNLIRQAAIAKATAWFANKSEETSTPSSIS